MESNKRKKEKRDIRHKKIRSKIKGTETCPRLSVYRSNAHIYAQIINDNKMVTLASALDTEVKPKADKENVRTGKIALAYEVGKTIAEKAKKAGIEKIVFDRGGNRYHGRVKALADGARDGGLKF